jgi:dienelactone hydrolase
MRSAVGVVLALALVSGLVPPLAHAADDDAIAFRSELIPFDSADLQQQALLTGGPATTPRTIAGELSLPNVETAKLPAVIVIHGDGGLVPNHPPWIRALNRAGFAVFTVDSYSGRGAFAKANGFVFIEGNANAPSRMVDAYRALDRMARHPRIDPDRIALMGFSGGGTAVRYAAMQRFAPLRAMPGQRFAAFVAVYPSCAANLRDDAKLLPAPLRVHHGNADRMTSMDLCREWVERARSAGADIEFRSHDGAGHGFDIPDGFAPVERPEVDNISRCRLVEADGGRLVSADTGKWLEEGDACIRKGAGGGPHRAARLAATSEVTAFLLKALAPRAR